MIPSFNDLAEKVGFFLTLPQTSHGFYMSAAQVFWKHSWKVLNIVDKRENAGNQDFLLFQDVFYCVKN